MVQRWIPEEPKVQYASAGIFAKNALKNLLVNFKVDLPESLDVVASYQCGARLVYHISGVDAAPPRLEVRISGTAGSIFIDLAQQTILFLSMEWNPVRTSIPPTQKLGWQVEKDFISSIRNVVPVKLTDFKSGALHAIDQAVDDAWRPLIRVLIGFIFQSAKGSISKELNKLFESRLGNSAFSTNYG